MYSRTESQFSGYQDLTLYYQRWIPTKVKGQIIITHGHGEHSESYQRVVDQLVTEGWSIFAWDWRGHGRSHGQRGYANQFNDYCYDFESFMNFLMKKNLIDQSLPLVLLAHSMGGLVQLRSLLSHPEWKFTTQVLSSPLLGVAIEVPEIKKIAGQVLGNLLPRLTLNTGILSTHVTRDPEVIRELDKDTLRHCRICSAVWFGALESIQYVLARADKFEGKLFLQLPDVDQVVNTPATLKFYENLKCQKSLKIYKGHKHEIYNDLDRKIVFEDLRHYLSQFLAKT